MFAVQFHISHGAGHDLINAATRKRLTLARRGAPAAPKSPSLTGDVFNDLVALGSRDLIGRVGKLLLNNPIHVIQESDSVTRIRVCEALDYVIDRNHKQVRAESSPLSVHETRATEQPPWHFAMTGASNDFDVLNPLCKPAWLSYIAARPGWFGYAFSRHKGTQKQLFIEQDEVARALRQVVRAVWRHFFRDHAFIALRHQVAIALVQHIGTGTIDLAMRSRLPGVPAVLNAKHLNMVLRHQDAFVNMARENPRLLVALTAWLANFKDTKCEPVGMAVALPAMRRDLLASGLPPKAWRYLAQHGFKRLQPRQVQTTPWAAMIRTLRALNAARWPALPPACFLRMLQDVAGYPSAFEQSSNDLAGWFWQWMCNAAHDRKTDTESYRYLFDSVPKWAWMVRHYQLQPDKNQRRKGIEWLEFMTDVVQSLAAKPDEPEWALWLPAEGWDNSNRLKAVPLQSPTALVREAIALHNCADAFQNRCRAENTVLISLRLWATDKRVALVSFELAGGEWRLTQMAGQCNQPITGPLLRVGYQLRVWVDYHHGLRALAPSAPQEEPLFMHLNWD